MSTLRDTDVKFITNSMSTINRASSLTIAASNGQEPPLLRLPVEIQRMIWAQVFNGCSASIGRIIVADYNYWVQRLVTSNPKAGRYSPHPLCYVCKSITNDVQQQFYRAVLVTADSAVRGLKPQIFAPIVRLSLTMEQAASMLLVVMPNIKDGNRRPKTCLELCSAPGLRYLELSWSVDLPGPDVRSHPRIQYMLTRLYFFNRTFELKIKLFAHHAKDRHLVCSGVITDASTTFEYTSDAEEDPDFERKITEFICKEGSEEGQERLNRIVRYLDNCSAKPRITRLGDEVSRRIHSRKDCCNSGARGFDE